MAESARVSFGSRLYKLLIQPKQIDRQLRNREVVCNILLLGTAGLMFCLFLLLLQSYLVAQNTYVSGRIAVCVGAFAYLGSVYWLSRAGRSRLAAYLLVLFYLVLALGSVWARGIDVPFSILLLGIVIVFSGILLAARFALYTAFLAGAALVLIYMADHFAWIQFSEKWREARADPGDMAGYFVEFLVVALVSWLFGREVERSLDRAQRAEAELIMEKSMLEVRVKERTAELRKAQIEEMQQMYQFAELGHLSTAMLHDLANYLTVLTLEIEGLNSRKHAAAITRTQHIIQHLDNMVDDVRARARGETGIKQFELVARVNDVVDLMQYHAVKAKVQLDWVPPTDPISVPYKGDPFRLTQAITILIGNAIEAYQSSRKPEAERRVRVRLEQNADSYIIRVVDWGKGISKAQRATLFQPSHSSKKAGMGIGLYLAEQMVKTHFKGTLLLHPDAKVTEFNILLPKKHD